MEGSHCDPSKVVCSGDGLVFGYIDHSIRAQIDTTRAGPGNLINSGDVVTKPDSSY